MLKLAFNPVSSSSIGLFEPVRKDYERDYIRSLPCADEVKPRDLFK
jgi:hypothetical protein